MLVLAAITDKLVDFATNVVGDLGLAGVFALMVPESACIPIPERGDDAVRGLQPVARRRRITRYTLFTLVLVGVVANVVGSWIAYAVGYYGRIELLEKHGRKLHVKPKDIERADRWFERHGEATVFFARMLPDRAHVHLAARRRRADAVLALHAVHVPRLRPVGLHARVHRQAGGRQLDEAGRTACTTSTTSCSR